MTAGTESINAVTLFTGHMAASVSFYESLGFRVVFGGAAEPFTSMEGLHTDRGPTHFVNLRFEADFHQTNIWGWVIFHTQTTAEVDDLYRAAVAAGYGPEMKPSNAPWGERYFHIRDPSGHELSFACRLA